ncbi:hypothetical protein C8F01DRAFT_1083331 [Mycena amicta]|nr:hypothetical protein C8F01DRAFT_1083331 [Mycena amicta]
MIRRTGRRSQLDKLGDIRYDAPLNPSNVVGDQQVHASADGRRVYSDVVNVIDTKRRRLDLQDLVEDDSRLTDWTPMSQGNLDDVRNLAAVVSSYETEPDMDDVGGKAGAEKRKRYASSDDPMSVWVPHAPMFLEELLRREGLGDFTHHPQCARCVQSLQPQVDRIFRCTHCGDYLQCEACVRSEHKAHPLHVIKPQQTNGCSRRPRRFYAATTDLPLYTRPVPQHFATATGSWLVPPATTTDPETCATLEALELFRLLQVVGNVNVHDFVGTLERLTDPTRVDATPVWKRSGRAHERGGLEGTRTGGLAVSCWACPQPGRNLPDGWKLVARSHQYLYKLMISVDANFRLKNRIRANERQDPALGEGKGYFVETKAYKEHLKTYIPEKERCFNKTQRLLQAFGYPALVGLYVLGTDSFDDRVWAIYRRENGGFANMDYIVLATLQDEEVKCITTTYDIACHWQVLLPIRADRIRERGELKTDLSKYKMQFALPVWHAAAHEINCRSKNTLSYAVGVGKTDGEGIERTWSLLNPIGWSTKEMGEGARHDAIEDKIDYLNFEKNVGQGKTLLRKLIVATAECKTQEEEFEHLTSTVSKETVRGWEAMVRGWEKDKTKPNPYLVVGGKEAGPSERQVMEELKAAELEDVRAGRAPLLEGGKMTAASFIKAGLQLEEAQRRILAELKAKAVITADRSSAIQEQRFSLLKKLKTFKQLQLTYMPGIEDIRRKDDEQRDPDVAPPKAEHIKIYLPSEVSADERQRVCARGVVNAEGKLRLGQCGDALAALRIALYVKTHLVYWRNANAVGQKGSTRSASLLERVAERIERVVRKYRQGYAAVRALKGEHFETEFRELADADINGRTGVENDAAALKKLRAAESARASHNEPSETTTKARVSWIWSVGGGSNESQLHDYWTKARARKDRWTEEVALLREEMKRVLRCLATVQREWERWGTAREGVDVALAGGLRAYAIRQSALHKRIGESFYDGWSKSVAGSVEAVMGNDGSLLRDLLAGTTEEVIAGDDDDDEEGEEEEDVAEEDERQEGEGGPSSRTRSSRSSRGTAEA